MKYTIGLDLGTTSVGWAVINNDKNKIQDLGVRLFESAENPKDGESLAKPRREARSMRRRFARRAGRMLAVKNAFIEVGVATDILDKAHLSGINPYELRVKGLDSVLSSAELYRAVSHIVKRRGYKSNRKNQNLETEDKEKSKNDENKTVLTSISQNAQRLIETKSRTVGEMMYKEFTKPENKIFFTGVRNRPGSYKNSVSREMLEDELRKILDTQREFGNALVAPAFAEKILLAFSKQKHYAEGNDIEKMVGFCTFENTKNGKRTNEMRASKATYSFQYANVLQKINSIKIKDGETGITYPLTDEQRKIAGEYIFSTDKPHYSTLRKKLELADTERFNMVNYYPPNPKKDKKEKDTQDAKDKEEKHRVYTFDEITKESEKNTNLPSVKEYLTLLKAIEETDSTFAKQIKENLAIFDEIATVLTLYRTDKDILEHIVSDISINVPKNVTNVLPSQSFSKFGHLSLIALHKIIPFLENGMTYDKAVEEAGYGDVARTRNVRLRPIPKDDHTLTNPVVKRTISQTIKVINAIIDKYGSPYAVHIELGRELSKDHKERKQIEKKQGENAKDNEDAVKKLHELFKISEPKGPDILKYKLWREQNNKCGYSGLSIDENRLLEDGYTEIDHIIPLSRSFDDSFANKVLVLKKENQEKGNRTPYEYMGSDEARWATFEALVASFVAASPRKKANLLNKKYVLDDLTSRTLNDTRYIAKYIKNYIEQGLVFAEGEKKKRVLTVNGMATAYVRKRWTLYKDREETSKHHAQDAVVVAVINDLMVQRIAHFSKIGEVVDYLSLHKKLDGLPDMENDKAKELQEEINIRDARHGKYFPEPWEGFHYELAARMSNDPLFELRAKENKIPWFKTRDVSDDELGIKPIFVSRMPRRKVTGRAHKDTLYSKKDNDDTVYEKIKLVDISKNQADEYISYIAQIMGSKTGEKMQHLLLLPENEGDPKKAFANFRKPMKDGTDGPLMATVRMPKVQQRTGMKLSKNNGFVERDEMIRVDVFEKPNKKGKLEYYFVPVYAHHKTKKVLPNVAFPSKEIMIDTDFVFSLYPYDLIASTKNDAVDMWYYRKANTASGQFSVDRHDKAHNPSVKNGEWSLSIKTLDKLCKYVVDLLGNYHKVHTEKRMPLS